MNFIMHMLSLPPLCIPWFAMIALICCHGVATSCSKYYSISHNGDLRILSGSKYRINESVALFHSFPITASRTYDWQLYHYIYEPDDESIVLVGLGNVFSSKLSGNVYFRILDKNPTKPEIEIFATRAINLGDELIFDSSFADPDVRYEINETSDVLSIAYQSIEGLESNAVCLDNVYAHKSKIENAENGLYSNKEFKKGDLIYMNPVAIVPLHSIDSLPAHDKQLLNYCIVQNNSDVCLFPLGLGSLINHAEANESNVVIRWYGGVVKEYPNGTQVTVQDMLQNYSIDDLERAVEPQLYIEYVATRDISIGQEITMGYGPDWTERYLTYLYARQQRSYCSDTVTGTVSEELLDSFSSPIIPSNSFFPKSFEKQCIGLTYAECIVNKTFRDIQSNPTKLKKFHSFESEMNDRKEKMKNAKKSFNKFNSKSHDTDTQPKVPEPMFHKRKK